MFAVAIRAAKEGDDEKALRVEDDPMSTLLLVIVILLVIGAVPSWPYSRSWGYAPSGLLGTVLLVLLILMVMGRI